MLFALLYLVLRRLVGVAGGSAADQVEILVLRHQLTVFVVKPADRSCGDGTASS